MNAKSSGILERLTVSSLEKCLAKLSKVSAGTWRIDSVRVSLETFEDALKRHDFKNPSVAAVYFHVKCDFPFASIILFDPSDIECISRCFLGYYSFPGARSLTQSEEIMLLELGNIILNSVVSAVSDCLAGIFMPPAQYIHGDARRIVEEFGTIIDLKQSFRIITLTLAIQCDKRVSKSEVLGIIPEKLANEMERRFSGTAKPDKREGR